MKKILSYLISLVTTLAILNYVIANGLSILYNSTFVGQSGGGINWFLEKNKNVQILAIGDSRCAHHIIPDTLGPNNFNLSHNGMSLVFHTGLIDQVIKYEEISVDTILLNLDIIELSFLNEKNEFDIKQLKYYYGKNTWITNKIKSLNFKERYKFLLPIYKWNGKVPTLIANSFQKNNESANGYIPTLPSKRDSINVMWQWQHTNPKQFINNNLSINNKCLEYLRHIKNLCIKKNITLICFISPTYNQFKIPNEYKSNIIDFFNKENIYLLDYSNEYYQNKKFQNIWVWSDVFHLNKKGANLLTKKIRNDLNNL